MPAWRMGLSFPVVLQSNILLHPYPQLPVPSNDKAKLVLGVPNLPGQMSSTYWFSAATIPNHPLC